MIEKEFNFVTVNSVGWFVFYHAKVTGHKCIVSEINNPDNSFEVGLGRVKHYINNGDWILAD